MRADEPGALQGCIEDVPITLGPQIAALEAQRELSRGAAALSKAFQRLSSGLRINSAADDVAGLSVALSLNTNSRLLTQAIRNINDGLSVANIAEGALSELSRIVQRQMELAAQSANGTLALAQRRAMNSEINALVEEFNRVVNSTSFNGMSLFGPGAASISIQAGIGSHDTIQLDLIGEFMRPIGDGSFALSGTYATSSTPLAPLVGDLNGDGIEDVVVLDYSSGLNVLIGNGDGTFAASYSWPITAGFGFAYNGVLGDVNGDSKLDVIASTYNGNDISVLLGNGDGTFLAEHVIEGSGTSVAAVQIADVNNDGLADLVSTESETPGAVKVHLGNGNGSFGLAVSFAANLTNPRDLRIGDLNGDGAIDLVVVNYDLGASSRIGVLLGQGNGSFDAVRSYQLGGNLSAALDLVDLNGDGILDVVTADSSTNNISILLGNGDGAFGAAVTYQSAGSPHFVAAGDFNGDGYLDLTTVNYSGGTASILLANGDGTFTAATSYTVQGGNPFRLALGDFDRDGRTDIVTANSAGNSASILLGDGEQTGLEQHFNITTANGARAALSDLGAVLERVTSQVGVVGATTSRLQIAVSNLQAMIVNNNAAYDRIMSVNVAEEVSSMVRLQVLQQVQSAVLAHSMSDSKLVLRLLDED